MHFIAFDLGASGGKIFLARCDQEKLTYEKIHHFDNRACLINGGLYWNICGIYEELVKGLRHAVQSSGDAIVSLGIDSFSNDFGIVDINGELVFPVRAYRDRRTARYAKTFDLIMSPAERYRLSGNQNALFNTLCQLHAMRESGQAYLFSNNNAMLLVPDLLAYFLTGRKFTEYTIASVTQMFDFRIGSWSREIVAAYGIPETFLLPIVQPGTIVGTTLAEINNAIGSAGFSVTAVCGHDTASAFLASPYPPGEAAIISSGTWVLVGMEVPEPIYSPLGLKYNFANEGGYQGHHRYLRNAMGTWILQELLREFAAEGKLYTFQELDALAEQAQPFQFLFDVDEEQFFFPGDMRGKIASSCRKYNGCAPASAAEFVRAVYESLAMRYRWTIDLLELISGEKLPLVSIVGGGARGELSCSFTASACGRTVSAGPHDATALGNIAVQMLASGKIASIEEARRIIRSSVALREFKPQRQAEWEAAYQRWHTCFSPDDGQE